MLADTSHVTIERHDRKASHVLDVNGNGTGKKLMYQLVLRKTY